MWDCWSLARLMVGLLSGKRVERCGMAMCSWTPMILRSERSVERREVVEVVEDVEDFEDFEDVEDLGAAGSADGVGGVKLGIGVRRWGVFMWPGILGSGLSGGGVGLAV